MSVKSQLEHQTLVLNRSRMAIHIKSVKDAICDVMSEVALFVDPDLTTDGKELAEDGSNLNRGFGREHDFSSWMDLTEEHLLEWEIGERPAVNVIRGARRDIKVPHVIKLIDYNEVPDLEIRLTRKNLMLRDNGSCQYCGKKLRNDDATLDHVYPKSKQGGNSWTNLVISCFPCNVKKRDRTPEEAGMVLLSKPIKPKWYPLSTKFGANAPDSWKHFIKDYDKLRRPENHLVAI